MRIKFFADTDTALVEFSDREVAETKEINENIYIDLDDSGNLVAMTIELGPPPTKYIGRVCHTPNTLPPG